jgi:hypothetical protein
LYGARIGSTSATRFTIIADDGNHRAFGAFDDVRLEAELLNAIDHVVDIGRLSFFFHDDDHGGWSLQSKERFELFTAAVHNTANAQ